MKFLNNIVDGGIIPFVMGTQTAATGTWTGTAHTITQLKDGQVIHYWLPFAGSGSATLNLTLADGTTTGAINCYYSGSSRLTTHFGAGNLITLIYRQGVLIGGTSYTGWWSHSQYNTDTTYYQRYNTAILATTAITAGNIIVNTGSGYEHLKLGKAFDITMPILYAGSAISAGSTGANNYAGYYFAVSKTQPGTWVAYKPIFIKGTLSGSMFTPVSTAPLIQTIPTSDDGYEYFSLGYCYSTANMQLTVEHRILKHINGAFQPFTETSAYAVAAGSATNAITAEKANKLATARTLTIGSSGKSFDGSANVSWSLADIGAAASGHTHSYAATSHTHGSITNDGKIGSTADRFILTGSGGALTAVAAATALSKLSAAPLTSPAFTGVPTAPTAVAGTNTTQIATTAFVKTAIDNVSSGGSETGFTSYTAYDGGMGTLNVDLTNSHAYVSCFYDFDGYFNINITAIPAGKKRLLIIKASNLLGGSITKPSLTYKGDNITLAEGLLCYEITRTPSENLVIVKKSSYTI